MKLNLLKLIKLNQLNQSKCLKKIFNKVNKEIELESY